MLKAVVERGKSKKLQKQNPYIAAPITPGVSLLFIAKAIRMGMPTMSKIIPKP